VADEIELHDGEPTGRGGLNIAQVDRAGTISAMPDIRAFLSIVLDPTRLAVLGYSVADAVDPSQIADALGIRQREALEAIGKLKAAGLLTPEGRLDRDVLRDLAITLPTMPPPDERVTGRGVWTDEEAQVLSRFFSGDRLVDIPSAQAKRRVVIERLAMEFEPGVRYQEPEVNFTLQLWHADYAALRRYLVDEGFMDRADGAYWRTGGRYAPGESD
jgi:hypothetical protein